MSINTRATKIHQANKEPQIKLFLPELLAARNESIDDAINKWLISNAGKIEVCDIVRQDPNTCNGLYCIGIIYFKK